jgi:predicted DNA-binding transcriptional regulator AlpA
MHNPPTERLVWRLAEVAKALGVSRRTLERERSAGRFPPPDLHLGKAPLWRPEIIRRWIEEGGCR